MASCLTIGYSSSFSMHSLTKSQKGPHPTCPSMKPISCFSRLVWVAAYFLDSNWQRTWRASSVFWFLSMQAIRYLQKSETSSLRKIPKYPFYLQTSSNCRSERKLLNSATLKGAAGSLVLLKSFPYLSLRCGLFIFSKAISQVHRSSLQGEWRCLVQRSWSSGRKQLASASAASCLDRLLSFQSFTTDITKSFKMGALSSENCPSAKRASWDSSYELNRNGQAEISILTAFSVLRAHSSWIASSLSPTCSLGSINCQQRNCSL